MQLFVLANKNMILMDYFGDFESFNDCTSFVKAVPIVNENLERIQYVFYLSATRMNLSNVVMLL